jgi:LPXTG-motif cell wall-anchored protein
VKSGNTGDAGITLYLGMGLVAVMAGAVIVTRKRKEN